MEVLRKLDVAFIAETLGCTRRTARALRETPERLSMTQLQALSHALGTRASSLCATQ